MPPNNCAQIAAALRRYRSPNARIGPRADQGVPPTDQMNGRRRGGLRTGERRFCRGPGRPRPSPRSVADAVLFVPEGPRRRLAGGKPAPAGAAPGWVAETAMPQRGIEEVFSNSFAAEFPQPSSPRTIFFDAPLGHGVTRYRFRGAASAGADLPPANLLRRPSGTGTWRPSAQCVRSAEVGPIFRRLLAAPSAATGDGRSPLWFVASPPGRYHNSVWSSRRFQLPGTAGAPKKMPAQSGRLGRPWVLRCGALRVRVCVGAARLDVAQYPAALAERATSARIALISNKSLCAPRPLAQALR